jgi:hypothetical protein
MNVYKLADALEKIETYNQVIHRSFNDKTKLTASADMLRQQADRIAELEKGGEVAGRFYWESVVDGHVMAVPSEGTPHYNKDDFPLYTTPQIKQLSDEELNKAFDYYCETDEGVLRFNYELRDEWKKEQLIRWKEALKKASEK